MKRIIIILLSFLFITCSSDDNNKTSTLNETSTLLNGLLVDYSFNGDSNDSSGNNYHGTNFGATYTIDRSGNSERAILFDGIDDYIDLPNRIELKPNAPFSFSFWIRYDSTLPEDRDVFNTSFEEDLNSGVYFNSQASTGNYAVNFGDGTENYLSTTRRTFVIDESIEINKWHQIVIIINSGLDMKIYVDSLEILGNYSGSGGELYYSNTSGSIGRHDRSLTDAANYFKGALDDFKYWNRQLTQTEIVELYGLQ